jgi:hemolysin III
MSTVREEVANSVSHGIGAVVAVGAGAVLITLASIYSDAWAILSASVYVASLVLLLTASTLYHAIPHAVAKRRLKVLDHCAIYLLIAGTYTPFTLIGLRGTPWGWGLFAAIWTLALAGIGFKLFFTGRFKRTSTLLYVLMGWLAMVAVVPMTRALPAHTLWLLLSGGIAYTLGTAFYLRHGPYSHAIWHAFVIIGATLHFIAVSGHVISG